MRVSAYGEVYNASQPSLRYIALLPDSMGYGISCHIVFRTYGNFSFLGITNFQIIRSILYDRQLDLLDKKRSDVMSQYFRTEEDNYVLYNNNNNGHQNKSPRGSCAMLTTRS